MPHETSPCGLGVERGETLLFDEAERHFPALRGVEPRIFENLLLPFYAVKYGALSSGEGGIAVLWAREGERLKLVWEEDGINMSRSRPDRPGFGLELLQRTLPYDLRAETRVEFLPQGLRFTLDMPAGPNILAD